MEQTDSHPVASMGPNAGDKPIESLTMTLSGP